MMDREPFATVENLRVIVHPWVVNVFGYRLMKDFSREAEAKALARKFDARVKKECRKAVEEFREKVIDAIIQPPGSIIEGCDLGCCNERLGIVEAIKLRIVSLPTVDESK